MSVIALLSLALTDVLRALGRVSPEAVRRTIKREVPGAFNTRTDEIEQE